VQAREVAEHALGKCLRGLRLVFDVHQKACVLPFEAGLDDQIGFEAFASREIRKDFFVERDQRAAVEKGCHRR
jgi:hypothetical protein